MGGMVVTQAAARSPGQISLLIYVAAFLPGDGQSLLDLTAYPEAADDQVQANLVIDGDPPVANMPVAAARGALFGCCDDEQAAWGVARLGGQPVVPFGQPVSLGDPPAAAFVALGRAYITCLRDRAIPPAMQRRMFEAAGCDPVIEIDTDHAPWVSRTDELVAALDRLAGGG
jgi:pimeloyl-ACP methyl ester carboxylesterase